MSIFLMLMTNQMRRTTQNCQDISNTHSYIRYNDFVHTVILNHVPLLLPPTYMSIIELKSKYSYLEQIK